LENPGANGIGERPALLGFGEAIGLLGVKAAELARDKGDQKRFDRLPKEQSKFLANDVSCRHVFFSEVWQRV
jgi:hypothetical protein